MNDRTRTLDFGAINAYGAHVFRIDIPQSRTQPIVITEDYGYRGDQGGIPPLERRALLERRVWSGIADTARREFNKRLKSAKTPTGRWRVGPNLVDRLLGKELCVLAWAAETARDEEIPVICSRWVALRPEERWWLFAMTVAEAGLPEDTARGWRRALFYALSDGAQDVTLKHRPRPVERTMLNLSLFEPLEANTGEPK